MQQPATSESYLLEALRRVVDGAEVTIEEIDAAVPDPRVLDKTEQGAWQTLRRWADDEDIRARDPKYAEYMRGLLHDEIARLQGYSEQEIERGEHTAARMPWWGCLVLLATSCGIIFWFAS